MKFGPSPIICMSSHSLFIYLFLLSEAQDRLKQLELERRQLDEQLKSAQTTMKHSEDRRDVLEARLLQVVPKREGDKIRRAHSFMPSTKEKPYVLEIKSSTLRRASKQ